jgi:hypothetical protein
MQADLGSRLASWRSGCDWKSESDRRDGCRFGNAVKGRSRAMEETATYLVR